MAGAYAVGGSLTIRTSPGYLPVIPYECPSFMEDIAKGLLPTGSIERIPMDSHVTSSTDVGDLSHVMPILRFTTGGFAGATHSDSFKVTDEEKAYIVTAKMMALTAYRLLKDKAKEAQLIIHNSKPRLTRDEYLNYMDAQDSVQTKNFTED